MQFAVEGMGSPIYLFVGTNLPIWNQSGSELMGFYSLISMGDKNSITRFYLG